MECKGREAKVREDLGLPTPGEVETHRMTCLAGVGVRVVWRGKHAFGCINGSLTWIRSASQKCCAEKRADS